MKTILKQYKFFLSSNNKANPKNYIKKNIQFIQHLDKLNKQHKLTKENQQALQKMKKNLILTKFKYTMVPYKDDEIMKLVIKKNHITKNKYDRSYNKIPNEYVSDDENEGIRSEIMIENYPINEVLENI